MIRVDSATKRRVTRQWQQVLPEFDAWRPMRFLRRVGPVLQGVTLDMASTGTEFYPTAHIHPLTMDFPVVSLMLARRLAGLSGGQERVSIHADGGTVESAAERLRDQSPLPLDRNPSMEEIVGEFRRFLDAAPTAKYGPIPESEQLILIAGYSSPSELAAQIEYVDRLSRSWSSIPAGYETATSWLENLVERASNPTALQELVATQAAHLKVERVGGTEVFG